jgi:hypothetical protein
MFSMLVKVYHTWPTTIFDYDMHVQVVVGFQI